MGTSLGHPAAGKHEYGHRAQGVCEAGGLLMFHPTGTAAMSPKDVQWGVTDPDLKVKGVEGLRIIDGSVWVSWSPTKYMI